MFKKTITTSFFLLVVSFLFYKIPIVAGGSGSLLKHLPTGNRTLYPFSFDDGYLYLNGDSTVEVWDVQTGRQIWQKSLEKPAVFRPRLTDKLVVTSGRTHLTAWNRLTGKQQWSYFPALKTDQIGVPVIHNGRIHFGEGHYLTTLDVTSGKRLWQFKISGNARIAYAPIGFKDWVLLGPGDGILYAFSAADGRIIWKVDHESDWQYLRQLHLSGEILVAGGYHDEIFGIRVKDGKIIWRFNSGNFINSHLVTKGKAYFWSPTGWIYALDAHNGSVVWKHRTTDFQKKSRKKNWAPIMAELVADDKRLFILAMNNVIHVLDLESGDKLDKIKLSEPIRPFIRLEESAARFLVGSKKGEILHLEYDTR